MKKSTAISEAAEYLASTIDASGFSEKKRSELQLEAAGVISTLIQEAMEDSSIVEEANLIIEKEDELDQLAFTQSCGVRPLWGGIDSF